MTSVEQTFVDGLFRKTLIIGLVASAIGWWLGSTHFGGSLLLGALVSAFNMRLIAWVSRKMTRAAARGEAGVKRWSLLLGLKLFVLAALTFVFIVVVGANVIAYVIGYSTFLAAIAWQIAEQLGRPDDPDDAVESVTESDTESF